MINTIKNISYNNVLHPLQMIFFPEHCIVCGSSLYRYEKNTCNTCWHQLPKTGYWEFTENPLHQLFWGRIPIERAWSWLYFRKGNASQKMLHEIKYRGNQQLAFEMGRRFGEDIRIHLTNDCPDYILPVPLSPKKKKARGYNQSEQIASGLSKSLDIPVLNQVLIRKDDRQSQTTKHRFERWENLKGAFDVKNSDVLYNKHVLLVDDVLTTGATFEACASVLLNKQALRISLLSLACA
jgi:ComF family protein